MTTKLIDVQKDLLIRFTNIYQTLKKEATDRRTNARLNQYENERFLLANKIISNNKLLVEAGAPKEYEDNFKEFEIINKKFIQTLTEFFSSIEVSYSPTSEEKTEDAYQKLKESEQRVAELERLLQQNVPKPNKDEDTMKKEKIDELLEMLVKSQIQQTKNVLQPRQRAGDIMFDVPTFSGDVSEYKAFKQIFTQIVSSLNWSPTEQFLKLRSKLQDSPKDAISSLYIEDGSYEIAWDILDRNYLSPRQLLEHDILRITNSNFNIKGHDAKSHINSKNTFVNIAANVRQLNLTGIDILVQFVILKMDASVRGRFEDFLGGSQELPTEEKIVTFLEKEARIYQNTQNCKIQSNDSKLVKQNFKSTHSHITTGTPKVANEIKCFICELPHSVTECTTFLASSNRESLLRYHKICIYCTKHRYNRHRPCYSRKTLKCDKCDEKHITEMHPLTNSPSFQEKPKTPSEQIASPKDDSITNTFLTSRDDANCTILPTAVATVVGRNGILAPIRCLVDLGSESSYICEHVVQSLGLRKYKTSIQIKGINKTAQCFANSYVNLQIKLNDPSLKMVNTRAFVLQSIADSLPTSKIKMDESIEDLADPHFNKPALVGILLGSDVAANIFKTGVASKITDDGWLLQPTHLGWIICGRGKLEKHQKEVSTFVTLNECMIKAINDKEMTEKILNFYEVPENTGENQSQNEYCEKLYQERHYRQTDGRYVVPTPWKQNSPKLGHSFRTAVKFFLKQENRWKNNKEAYIKSNQFMEEYIRMGHMSEITNYNERFKDDESTHTLAYISILRKEAITTKLRNVFHASLPTSNGISLNDTMHEGEKLQADIFKLLIKARSFKYFFGADIEKMFRQIYVLPADRDKMRIVWRSNPLEPLKQYRLNTVTYGTDAAPWQAIRTIHQCAHDNAPDQNLIHIIKNAFYVDDLLYGGDTINECQDLINKITTTMGKGGFPLTKWLSNNADVLKNVPPSKLLSHYLKENASAVKILGLLYDEQLDEFCLKTKQHDKIQYTKRGFSSIAASIYDPLGFTLPVTMRSRLFAQGLWREKYGWDDVLPEKHKAEFISWYKDQENLSEIKFSRWLGTNCDHSIELIGFSDASGTAKAAVIYSRVNIDGKYFINFVAAKGNVNKLNNIKIIESQQNTIPKNELDAVVILVDLFEKIRAALDHCNIKFRAYVDSQIALAWIRNSSSNENKFIRRRVEKIKKFLNPHDIHYVKSAENPADPASRGMSAKQLKKCSLWLNGPSWLLNKELPETPLIKEKLSTKNFLTLVKDDIFKNISKLSTLLRVIVFMTRWIHHKRNPKIITVSTTLSYEHAPITADEINRAKIIAIKYYQNLHFFEEVEKINKNQALNKRHWLSKLSPFLDNRKLMCVGGRLWNANLPQEQRHPILIPPGRFATMIIDYTHKYNLHAGNSLTIQKLITEYYIKGIKQNVYHVLNKCTKCLRWKSRVIQPKMSHLPPERVEIGGVFEKVGVDLAGPMQIKASTLRTNKVVKIWIAVFVCLVTKAVHLEIVSSLTAEEFLAALTRLTSRRGQVKEIWSDNGTNFQGANRQIKQAWKSIVDKCIDITSIQEIKWKFIPVSSPTFGGLWEACVKSIKYFLKRMGSTTNFTYDQLYTLLCRIEALLNSRPLYPNPVEPSESLSLTPFHFITMKGFKLSPIDALNDNKLPLTKKWLTIIQIQREFWEKFKTEYLYSLQKRQKWLKHQPNLNIGDVVLIKNANTTPGEWKIGKVSKVYPDPEGIVRKVDVKDSLQKEKLHAVNQLVPLNKEEEEPAVRRSPRTNKLTAVQVLLTWLTLTSSVKALNYTTLSAGTHLHKIDEIYLKATDMSLVMKTKFDVNSDLLNIKASALELKNACKNMTNMPKVKSFCYNVSNIVNLRAEQVTNSILNIYGISHRRKRWSGMLTGAKFAIKYIAPVLTAGGVVYQEYQISNLKHENDIIKERMRKTSMILLKITEIEHEDIDHKLSEMIAIQKETNMINDINVYINTITIIMDTLLERHLQILQLKPFSELKEQYSHISHEMPDVIIAPVEDIFDIAERQLTTTKSGEITLLIKVPLVYKDKAIHYGIINIPDENGYIFDIHNKEFYLEAIVNHKNTSYFIPSADDRITESIFKINQWQNITNCWAMIFRRNFSVTPCNITYAPITSNQIIKIEDNVALTLAIDNVNIICDDKKDSLNISSALINYPNCILSVGSQTSNNINITITTHQTNLPMILQPPKIKLSDFKPRSNEIIKLEKELEDITEDSSLDSYSKGNKIPLLIYPFALFAVILIIICLMITICCIKKNSISRDCNQQLQTWDGPAADDRHRVPQSEIFLELRNL